MDPFLAQDIEASRTTPPGEKLVQALNLMRLGIELKREQLRRNEPELTEPELETKLKHWLARDG